jgi:hypothetical protein
MNQEEYYKQSLAGLQAELAHEIDFANGLQKTIDRIQSEGHVPLEYIKQALAEREARRDTITKAIEILKASVKK